MDINFSPEAFTITHLHRCPNLVIKSDTPKGRGVFASAPIPAKTIIDVCPVLVLGLEENKEHIEKSSLYHYTYNWPIPISSPSPSSSSPSPSGPHSPKTETHQALILGLGSMFNHSTHSQNVVWERDIVRQIVTYRALRDIAEGEELCISYGSHLTFKDVDAPSVNVVDEDINQLNQIQLD
ncbi:protein methyltransferase [Westerdykella ornata]|uniref:Protein methyltransferase n=1 Tax=Westerdykella ornata TaxID=318751 RepID=A0A6A6J936_WESOR|nr:protein methyltransferase [Westerdykella ornata]KAF2272714.1 protein methyltransferase [Westerdykella ornata]